MEADTRLREIAAAYPGRIPRRSIDAVARLVETAGVAFPPTNVAVVGTNGKTSTATFVSRLARAAGLRDGLTTSPHILSWGERIRIGGAPIGEDDLATRVERLHEAAGAVGRGELRFFDLLTLAAADAFVAAGVEVGVFEAGIGGRLDATRVVPAVVVALTGIGLDHAELLGATALEILHEKLGVARAGSTVVAAQLDGELSAAARAFASCGGLELRFAASGGTTFLERNADLAVAVAEAAGIPVATGTALAEEPVLGRLHRFESDGVEVLADAAHNPQAWDEIAPVLPPSFVAVVSVSADRDPTALRSALARAVAVVATTAWEGRSLSAADLAAVLGSDAVEDPGEAVVGARERARAEGVPLVVLGSTYLLTHAYRVL